MAGSATSLRLLDSLATASSLSPFAQQLELIKRLGAPRPLEAPTQYQAHLAATSNGLQQLTLVLQQSTPCSDSSSSDPDAPQAPPELSQDALQAVLLLTEAATYTLHSMRQAMALAADFSAMMPPEFTNPMITDVPSLQEFVGSILSSGLISSFSNACNALAATFNRHPHLKPAPGLTQQALGTLHQLHSLAAALFNLFFELAAAWPRDDEVEQQLDNTGLVNPTIRPIVQPAVRLCTAMLSMVRGPAAAPPAATDPAASTAAAPTPAPTATAPTATAPAAVTAAEASCLKAALLFGYTLSNILRQFSDDYSHKHANTDTFAAELLLDTRSKDSIFQLMLALLALTAQKLYHQAGGRSVRGDGTPVDPHHLQLLQAVGLAAPPQALLAKPSVTPHPYGDETQNAHSVTCALRDIILWVCLEVRDRQQAQDCRVIESQMPLVSAHAMSLTLLELWSLVQPEEGQHKQGKYILFTGMLLLVAKSSFLVEATEEQRGGLVEMLSAAWCKALPGAALSVQYKGRPLIYDGDLSVRLSFLAEQIVGEIGMHWLYSAESLCPEQLAAFLVSNPGPAFAGAEWSFRVCGQELVNQPNPTKMNCYSGDDPAMNLPLSFEVLIYLLDAAAEFEPPAATTTAESSASTTSSDSQLPSDTASTGAPDTAPAASLAATATAADRRRTRLQRLQLHPDLAAAITTSFKDAQQLWLLLLTLNKFAMCSRFASVGVALSRLT